MNLEERIAKLERNVKLLIDLSISQPSIDDDQWDRIRSLEQQNDHKKQAAIQQLEQMLELAEPEEEE